MKAEAPYQMANPGLPLRLELVRAKCLAVQAGERPPAENRPRLQDPERQRRQQDDWECHNTAGYRQQSVQQHHVRNMLRSKAKGARVNHLLRLHIVDTNAAEGSFISNSGGFNIIAAEADLQQIVGQAGIGLSGKAQYNAG